MTTSLKTWEDCAPDLVAVAGGRKPANLVFKNLKLVNVHSREILDGWEIAVFAGRFAYVGEDASHCVGEGTEIVDLNGRFVTPGFCDGHMHIESGMLTPAEFARAVTPHGTTTMFTDPHEIANVFGLEGVRLMHDEALMQPINIYTQMPSCAPSAPGLETTGFEISERDVEEAMSWPGIIGLGEMMNFLGVIAGDAQMLGEMKATIKAGKTVGGHYASPNLGPEFHAYVAGGAADDHEGTQEADAIARVRQGMKAMLRLGSAWYDVKAQITAVTEKGLDPRGFILCTDDCHSGTLVNDGHMDRVIRHAVDCGLDPLIAIQMASLNTAEHFGLARELGSIAPGRRADLVVTSDLINLPIEAVYAHGVLVAQNGQVTVDFPHFKWPNHTRQSVNMGASKQATDFEIRAPEGANQARVRVIGVVENQAPTQALEAELLVREGLVESDEAQDVCQIALVERHKGTGQVTNGFVSGFGYEGKMAMASTVAHDSHHMIVVGTDREMMAQAANRLQDVGGGVVVFKDGVEMALVSLPIAGLMSDAPASKVAAQAEAMVKAMEACGCKLNNAYMQHSLLALVVIPEIRISDLGLVDVRSFELVDLFVRD